MLKTINVSSTVTPIEVTGGAHTIVTNRGESTVYLSKMSNIVADGDGVKAIDGGSSDVFRDVGVYTIVDGVADWHGTLYALSDGDTKIQLESTNSVNFRRAAKGGGASMSNYTTTNDVLAYVDDHTTVYFGEYEEG